jgi:TPR repeat protein
VGWPLQHGSSSSLCTVLPGSLGISDLRQLAASGAVEAQLALAKRYHRGDGIGQDLATARDWYKKAADQQCAEALYEYAQLCNEAAEECGEAISLITQSAEQGFVRAQVYLVLGDLFNPVTTSSLTTEEMEVRAEDGDTDAMLTLAVRYWTGRDAEMDVAWGSHWIDAAVDEGSVRAQLFSDFALYIATPDSGDGEGVDLLKRATMLGNDYAALWLARTYALGLGIPVDDEEAQKWLLAAADLGNKQALFKLALDDYIFTGCRRDEKKEEQLAKMAEELEYSPLHFPLADDSMAKE